eukprot:749442-Hanusia_phi.AAC.3
MQGCRRASKEQSFVDEKSALRVPPGVPYISLSRYSEAGSLKIEAADIRTNSAAVHGVLGMRERRRGADNARGGGGGMDVDQRYKNEYEQLHHGYHGLVSKFFDGEEQFRVLISQYCSMA